jgi:transcription factor SOX7/8/10/18 (SOX group E/F)
MDTTRKFQDGRTTIIPIFDTKLWKLRSTVVHMSTLQPWPPMPAQSGPVGADEDGDTSHRPPNAFILYSQAMRSSVRQENPSLSNTEISGLLGKMWKEVPSDIKMQYKQKASFAQEQFKRDHPNYTYRKARRKRALNELLTKSAQGFQMPGFPGDPNLQAMMSGGVNPYLLQMYSQGQGTGGQQAGGAFGFPGMGGGQMAPGMPGQQPQGYAGYPGVAPTAPFQYQGK